MKAKFEYWRCERMRNGAIDTWYVQQGIWQTRPDDAVEEITESEYNEYKKES